MWSCVMFVSASSPFSWTDPLLAESEFSIAGSLAGGFKSYSGLKGNFLVDVLHLLPLHMCEKRAWA